MRILFIDDNPEFLGYVSEILRNEGHEVVEIDSANDAIYAIKNIAKYDLVILDIMIMLGDIIDPEEANETGTAIYKRIRKNNSKIRILVLSALGKQDIWNAFNSDSNVSYYGKPIPSNIQSFLKTVEGLDE